MGAVFLNTLDELLKESQKDKDFFWQNHMRITNLITEVYKKSGEQKGDIYFNQYVDLVMKYKHETK